MADLIIKPATGDGNKLILQDKAGGAVLTTADSGATIADGIALGTPASGVMTNMTGAVTASLVDDAVTLAKMAHGADGSLITYSASTVPELVPPGTTGHVLTSRGNASTPTFQAAAGGITVCEMYYLNTAVYNSTGFTITGNYTKHDTSIGSGITDSSGVFGFATTGIYRIEFSSYSSYGTTSRYVEGKIQTTIDNSTWIERATGMAARFDPGGNDVYTGTYCSYMFNVTDTSNCKVRFSVNSENQSGYLISTSTIGRTYWIFTRIGDT